MFRTSFYIFFLFSVFAFSNCSSVQPSVSSDASRESSPTPKKFPKAAADANFKEEWESKYEATSAELERNHKLWKESKIENYEFVCQQIAGGMNGWNAVLIKVQGDNAVSIERTPKDSVAKIDGYENFDTIDKTFDYLRKELEDGRIINVKYNEKFGYPKEFTVIYNPWVDAWTGAIIEKFEIIK